MRLHGAEGHRNFEFGEMPLVDLEEPWVVSVQEAGEDREARERLAVEAVDDAYMAALHRLYLDEAEVECHMYEQLAAEGAEVIVLSSDDEDNGGNIGSGSGGGNDGSNGGGNDGGNDDAFRTEFSRIFHDDSHDDTDPDPMSVGCPGDTGCSSSTIRIATRL